MPDFNIVASSEKVFDELNKNVATIGHNMHFAPVMHQSLHQEAFQNALKASREHLKNSIELVEFYSYIGKTIVDSPDTDLELKSLERLNTYGLEGMLSSDSASNVAQELVYMTARRRLRANWGLFQSVFGDIISAIMPEAANETTQEITVTVTAKADAIVITDSLENDCSGIALSHHRPLHSGLFVIVDALPQAEAAVDETSTSDTLLEAGLKEDEPATTAEAENDVLPERAPAIDLGQAEKALLQYALLHHDFRAEDFRNSNSDIQAHYDESVEKTPFKTTKAWRQAVVAAFQSYEILAEWKVTGNARGRRYQLSLPNTLETLNTVNQLLMQVAAIVEESTPAPTIKIDQKNTESRKKSKQKVRTLDERMQIAFNGSIGSPKRPRGRNRNQY